MSPSRKCYQFRLMLRAARAPAVRAPRCAPRPLQRPVCVRPVQRLDLGASRHRLFSTSASAPPEPPAVALSQATKVDAQAPPSGPTNAEDRERPRYTYRQKPAQPQERWFSALKKQQIGAAIDFLKQDNPGKAPAWTQVLWAAGKSGVPTHVVNAYKAVAPDVKQDPIFWTSLFAACRQPGISLSEFAMQAFNDMTLEYKPSWREAMSQLLVNVFLALSASETAPQIVGLGKAREWARARSLLHQTEAYSALVYAYTRRRHLNEVVSVLEEAANLGVPIHSKNLSDAINQLVVGNRPADALNWVKHAAQADIPVDGLSLNSLHRQLYALGQHGAARELEDLFEKFKHTPDLIASTKLMIAMSSANIDAAMPRVIAYFEKHVKPRADEEAYRTLIRLCAKAMRGDLVGKYWQEAVELSKRTNVPLSAKLWDQAIEAFITTGQAEGFYRALPKASADNLSPDTVARVACFLAQNEHKSSPYLERVRLEFEIEQADYRFQLESIAKSGKASRETLNAIMECYVAIGGRSADVLATYDQFALNQRQLPDETSFTHLFAAATSAAELDAQVARVAKERSEQGPRLAISDRTRAAVVRALLRLGSSVAEAQAKAEQIGAKLGFPSVGMHTGEALLLHRLGAAKTPQELRLVERDVKQHQMTWKVQGGQASVRTLDHATLAAAERVGEEHVASIYSMRLRTDRGGSGDRGGDRRGAGGGGGRGDNRRFTGGGGQRTRERDF